MIKPPALKPGDRVAAISLSWGGPGAIPNRYEAGKRQLEHEFGVELIATPHARRDPDWLDANPAARAEDLMGAVQDPTIKAIISTIGGDDSIRTLRHTDLDTITENPKIFLGYSDATVTHLAYFKAGVGSFYGPGIMSGFAENGGMFPYMVDSVRRTLFQPEPIGEIKQNREGWTVEHLPWEETELQEQKRKRLPTTGWRYLQGAGSAEGHLIGGCLEVLDWLIGTTVWPDLHVWEGAILFLETSEEAPPPEALSRFLRSLAAMGILQSLSGILLGRPGGDAVPPDQFIRYDTAITRVVSTEEGLTNLPVITGMDFGHTAPPFVIPYGANARLDCDCNRFTILENAVVD